MAFKDCFPPLSFRNLSPCSRKVEKIIEYHFEGLDKSLGKVPVFISVKFYLSYKLMLVLGKVRMRGSSKKMY